MGDYTFEETDEQFIIYRDGMVMDAEEVIAALRERDSLQSQLSEAKKDAEGWRQAQANAFSQVADWSMKNRELHWQLSEARAHCERLRDGMVNIEEYWNGGAESTVDAIEHCRDVALSLLEETPEQSLAEVKAQAILEACRESMPGPCNPPDDPPAGYQEFCEGVAAVADYAASLRQQGKW